MKNSQAGLSGLGQINTLELRSELLRREKAAKGLVAKRDALIKKLEALDAEIKALGESVSIGTTGQVPRAKNQMNLIEAIQTVLKGGKELGVPAIVAALPGVGYVSYSPNLRTMVNATLLKKKFFKRVGRGVYSAK